MKPALRIPYKHVPFVWISNHYDLHVAGLCRINGEIMWFELPKGYRWDGSLPRMLVSPLSRLGKARWLLRKWIFEILVGRHWTYPDRTHGTQFEAKSWWRRLGMKIYYWRWIGAYALLLFLSACSLPSSRPPRIDVSCLVQPRPNGDMLISCGDPESWREYYEKKMRERTW